MPPTRIAWIDSVRGGAMALLLIWHCTAIPWTLGVPMPDPLWAFNGFFMPFRMPMLMFLSGVVLSRSLAKPAPRYFAGKFAAVAWPYVVWLTIAGMLSFAPAGWPGDLREWGPQASYLWFLFFIGAYYLVAPALQRLPLWLPVAVGLAGAVILPHGGIPQRWAYFAVFFFLGHLVATRRGDVTRLVSRPTVLACAAVAVTFGLLTARDPFAVQFDAWTVPLSLAGIVAVLCLPAAGRVPDLLGTVGRSSIVYYVAHFPVMVVISREFKDDVGAWDLAAINLLVALLVCTALARLDGVAPVRWLFRAPRPLTAMVERLLSGPRRRHPAQESNLRRSS